MTEQQTKEHEAFIGWLYSLSIMDYGKTTYRLLKECHVGKRTLCAWRKGTKQPGWHCKNIINRIAGKTIYNTEE